MKKAWVLSYPLSAQRRLWSDWADVQADLSLRWAHSPFVCFVMRRLKWRKLSLIWLKAYVDTVSQKGTLWAHGFLCTFHTGYHKAPSQLLSISVFILFLSLSVVFKLLLTLLKANLGNRTSWVQNSHAAILSKSLWSMSLPYLPLQVYDSLDVENQNQDIGTYLRYQWEFW